ncbi:hypothetical protein BGX27_008273 [Mortierella sp. AM989]|nr:hypothetical protein BGX27_008273 [Mortierella sp. AM989]
MHDNASPALPEDCIFEVLRYLSAEDLVRVSCTCSAWYRLSAKNSLWQRLCLERWKTWPSPSPFSSYYNPPVHQSSQLDSQLDGVMDEMSLDPRKGKASFPPETLPNVHAPELWYSTLLPPYEMDSWKDVYQERHQKDATVRLLLEEMIEDSRNRMRHMDGIANIGMIHARDVLENIIAGRNGEERNLTRTYYARKTLKRLQRGWVLDQWRAYRLHNQNFPIWQGCGLMAMFSDHEMELSDIDRQFQALADEFLDFSPLQRLDLGSSVISPTTTVLDNFDRYGSGSFSTSSDNRSHSEGNRPDSLSNNYSRYYEAQIDRLKQLIKFFTQEKGFKGNTDNYYDPFNSFIDKVLVRKVGIPISLCIVFDELARRVGIVGVELMGFPQHFMIRYRPQAPNFDRTTSPLSSSEDSTSSAPPAPPTYFLDLFHPPHRLLSTEEYDDYFSMLSVPRPANIYRDLPTPPLEIFLRCLRNIILAVEQTGGAGRIGSDHQTSLYSGITQLLTLHPSEEWGLYVLWLKYLSNFWPEDIGFIRTSIKDMEGTDSRREQLNLLPRSSHGQTHRVFRYDQGSLSNTEHVGARNATRFTSSTIETIKILRAQVRELEAADEIGEVGHIRRRRRPRTALASAARTSNQSNRWHHVQHDSTIEGDGNEPQVSSAEDLTTSSPTIDQQSSHARHRLEHQNSISGEQQSGSLSTAIASSEEYTNEFSPELATAFSFGGEERRRPEPEYYVGEVFRHLLYRYTGAIYGYDLSRSTESTTTVPADQTPSNSVSSIVSVSISGDDASMPSSQPSSSSDTSPPLAPGETAPSSVPLGNLQFSELGPLEIEDVGQYFEAWDGQHGYYVMNKELRKLYPTEDFL